MSMQAPESVYPNYLFLVRHDQTDFRQSGNNASLSEEGREHVRTYTAPRLQELLAKHAPHSRWIAIATSPAKRTQETAVTLAETLQESLPLARQIETKATLADGNLLGGDMASGDRNRNITMNLALAGLVMDMQNGLPLPDETALIAVTHQPVIFRVADLVVPRVEPESGLGGVTAIPLSA